MEAAQAALVENSAQQLVSVGKGWKRSKCVSFRMCSDHLCSVSVQGIQSTGHTRELSLASRHLAVAACSRGDARGWRIHRNTCIRVSPSPSPLNIFPIQYDMSTHEQPPTFRLYPAYCFRASPTYDKWVKITAADVQALRSEPDFQSKVAQHPLGGRPLTFICTSIKLAFTL